MTQTPVPLKNHRLAALLAWLVPGLGHFYQGRTGKAILYAICILGLFITGMIVGEGKVVYWRWLNPFRDPENFRFSYLCQLPVGLAALPALIQETLRYYEIPALFGGFMAATADPAVNEMHPRLGKLVEIGSVYTMMAGLLNILAIYDAYDGPAYAEEDAATAETGPAENQTRSAGAPA